MEHIERQQGISDGVLKDVRMGIESEALRVGVDGSLSQNPHPFALNDRRFTMDFAESQLEIVTEPLSSPRSALQRLNDLTDEALRTISPEVLWPFSMPPQLPGDDDIAIADFGSTEEGRRARLYRQGLAARYGKARQMISGIHVNISAGSELMALAGASNDVSPLLSAAGEFYRNLGSLILLTGASPIRGYGVEEPVISTRCGQAGYGGSEFSTFLDLSSVDAYTRGIEAGIRKELPSQVARKLVADGRVLQLSKSVFQSESEYYAPLRLRRSVPVGAAQSVALRRGGPEYIELRFLDRNPFTSGGIDEDTLNLIHLVFLKGLTSPIPAPSRNVLKGLLLEAQKVAGTSLETIRNPKDPEGQRIIKAAAAYLRKLQPLADRLDAEDSDTDYQGTLNRYLKRLARPVELPSALIDSQYSESGMDWSHQGLCFSGTTAKEADCELSHTRI